MAVGIFVAVGLSPCPTHVSAEVERTWGGWPRVGSPTGLCEDGVGDTGVGETGWWPAGAVDLSAVGNGGAAVAAVAAAAAAAAAAAT